MYNRTLVLTRARSTPTATLAFHAPITAIETKIDFRHLDFSDRGTLDIDPRCQAFLVIWSNLNHPLVPFVAPIPPLVLIPSIILIPFFDLVPNDNVKTQAIQVRMMPEKADLTATQTLYRPFDPQPDEVEFQHSA
jgi:hypothetical protein